MSIGEKCEGSVPLFCFVFFFKKKKRKKKKGFVFAVVFRRIFYA